MRLAARSPGIGCRRAARDRRSAPGRFRRLVLKPAAPPAPSGPAISLAILPFRNNSGDPALDSHGATLSQVLGTMLQSSRVRTVPGDRLHQVLQDLRIGANATVAPVELARVADLTNARRVLSGSFARFGDAIRIDATLQDLDRGDVASLTAMAPNEAGLLAAMSELADSVRTNLARGSPDVLAELKSTGVEALDWLVRGTAPLPARACSSLARATIRRRRSASSQPPSSTRTSRWRFRRSRSRRQRSAMTIRPDSIRERR